MPRSTDPSDADSAVAAYIGLGANLGDPRATLDAAFVAIATLPGTKLRRASSLYRTAPVDSSGPDFLNAVVQIDTRLGPAALLAAMQSIERVHGRLRPFRNAPRTLDLDLLLYGTRQIDTRRLTVPHPRLHLRGFVLHPLAEVSPGLRIPFRGPVQRLLRQVGDQRVDRLAE